MSAKIVLQCAKCGVDACRSAPGAKTRPPFCPVEAVPGVLEEVRATYEEDADVRELAATAARTEAGGYCRQTRVEEIMAFARRLGATHLGIATCVGTRREARLAQEIFEAHGFRVSSVVCKVGSIPKETLGLEDAEKIRPGQFEAACNPVGQARLLAEAGTDLNVVLGLCVGHDTLFLSHSAAPATVLMVKDRVTGHNPAAALYTSTTYYQRLRRPDTPAPEGAPAAKGVG